MIGPKWVISYKNELLNHQSLAQRALNLGPHLFEKIFEMSTKGWSINNLKKLVDQYEEIVDRNNPENIIKAGLVGGPELVGEAGLEGKDCETSE